MADLDQLFAHRPPLAERLQRLNDSLAQDGNPPKPALALCRARIQHIHGCPFEPSLSEADRIAIEHGTYADFSPGEQAALALADKLPHQHHDVTDEEVANLEVHFGQAGAVAIITAASFIDTHCRWQLVSKGL